MALRQDADTIIAAALNAAQPDTAVRKALAATPKDGAILAYGSLYLASELRSAWLRRRAD